MSVHSHFKPPWPFFRNGTLLFVTPQENYCDALTQVFNETSLKEVDINNLLEISIASDTIGGGKNFNLNDFISYFGI